MCGPVRKEARDGARQIGKTLGLKPRTLGQLGENDRSSTEYIAPPEFWEVVRTFFDKPNQSIRGWETASHAQARIVGAVRHVIKSSTSKSIAIVSA